MSARLLLLDAAVIGFSTFLTAAAPAAVHGQAPAKSVVRGGAAASKNTDTASKASASLEVPQCAGGMVLIPASLANPPAASPIPSTPSMPAIPSAKGLIANAAKNKLLKKSDSAPVAPAPVGTSTASASPFLCVTPAQAQAYLQSAQAAASAPATASPEQPAATQKDAMKSAVTTALAVTPQGMLVSGAVAAAPTATGAVKSLAGRFARGDSKENMIRDLRQGRLQVKSIRFVAGSDEIVEGFEQTLTMLADALQSVEGQFALVVPAESDGKSTPDTATAHRRAARFATHLQLAGIGSDRLLLADDAIGARTPGGRALSAHMSASKVPKTGEARVELVRVATKP